MPMQTNRSTNSRRGFTLVELMITVGLIGVLSAIAIPNFIAYQARARRSEAYANLASLARAQKAYLAERNQFLDVFDSGELTLPDPGLYGDGNLGTTTMPWDAQASGLFDEVGWSPEGAVYYSYEVNTGKYAPCGCNLCFTATAHGDVDGDGGWSALMYVHPQVDPGGNVVGECGAYLMGLGAPTRGGQPVYDEVVLQPRHDDY
jgi:type IV pilus assembly protein PilA